VSLSSETMLKLMAYADGELEGDERRAAESLLASDAEAAEFVEQLAGLGTIVQAGHGDRHAHAIALFDVADAVMAKAAAEATKTTTTKADAPARVTEAATVHGIDVARAKRAQRLKLGGGIVAALAFAAAVFVYARPNETPMAKGPSTVASSDPNTAQQTASNGAPGNGGAGVEVSAVESPGHSVSVFYLPTANELSTSVVVWVDETGEK